MNNDAAEKKIRLYEADRALRDTPKFRDILSYILSQKFDPSLFGSRLQKARKAARITQCNLGEGIGVTGANICKLEKGKSGNEIRKGIRVDQLCYFCDTLNVTPEYLLGFTENPTEHIVSESSERSAVLEAWNAFKTEKNPENQVRAIDPIYSDAPEVAATQTFQLLHTVAIRIRYSLHISVCGLIKKLTIQIPAAKSNLMMQSRPLKPFPPAITIPVCLRSMRLSKQISRFALNG